MRQSADQTGDEIIHRRGAGREEGCSGPADDPEVREIEPGLEHTSRAVYDTSIPRNNTAALGSLNVFSLLILLAVAAVLGDTCNYWVGHFFGEKITANPRMPVKKKHLEATQRFFERHGGKTILLARFVPVIRTFAPFVAGAGLMNYGSFLLYNVTGGVLWVAIGTIAGYFFGSIPIIKNNFTFFILGIVVVSFIPIMAGMWMGRRRLGEGRSQSPNP
jgi:membrane-associated protein